MKTFDLIVIGGGRAGGIASSAANKGKKVALIEKSSLGGTCPNRGCIPSKLLIGHAHVIRGIQNSERHFVSSHIDAIDQQKIIDTTNEFVNNIGGIVEKGLPEGVTIFKGEGKFISDKEIVVNNETLTAETIVIGTGARPRKTLHEKAWTSDNLFPLNTNIPKSVTIVGAGFIGVELSNFFDAIGVETVLIARGSELLKKEDKEIGAIFKEEFTKHVNVKFNTSVTNVKHDENGFSMTLENTSGEKTTHTSEVLIETTGRIPNADNLGLENTAITTNARGYIERDEFCETKVKGVYAVGDVASKYALQHIAVHEVNYVISRLFDNHTAPLGYKYVPHAVFSDPEIASVGMTEEEAKEKNINYVSATTNWAGSAKARSTKLNYQRTKFIVNPDTHEILGCHMIGPDSATLIHQIISVMHIDNDIKHLANMIYIHPAVNEIILAAARNVIAKI